MNTTRQVNPPSQEAIDEFCSDCDHNKDPEAECKKTESMTPVSPHLKHLTDQQRKVFRAPFLCGRARKNDQRGFMTPKGFSSMSEP